MVICIKTEKKLLFKNSYVLKHFFVVTVENQELLLLMKMSLKELMAISAHLRFRIRSGDTALQNHAETAKGNATYQSPGFKMSCRHQQDL